jgi:hypothetical protein
VKWQFFANYHKTNRGSCLRFTLEATGELRPSPMMPRSPNGEQIVYARGNELFLGKRYGSCQSSA